MKVAVLGLWHLGIVTAACLAKAGHNVIAYDPDRNRVQNLQNGNSPIFEPGLDDLLQEVVKENKLHYSYHPQAIEQAEIIWVNFDTPVDDHDNADIYFVINEIKKAAEFIQKDALLLISSQLPVGTTQKIREILSIQFPEKNLRFGCIPENLRLGKAISVFMHPDRVIVGLQDEADRSQVKQLLSPFTENFIWMSIESAEMTKHALNAFLAISVTFINEIAVLCEKVGANASEVEAGLKSEERIGHKAYLRAGSAIAGGTLLRDIHYLNKISADYQYPAPLLASVSTSNVFHKDWARRKMSELFLQLDNKTIAVLGLTYKANTNTLRRSSSLETCLWLHQQGMKINAYDPAIQLLPKDYADFIDLKHTLETTLANADAVFIATEWPEFQELAAEMLMQKMIQPIVLDPGGFLKSTLGNDSRVHYHSVGRAQ